MQRLNGGLFAICRCDGDFVARTCGTLPRPRALNTSCLSSNCYRLMPGWLRPPVANESEPSNHGSAVPSSTSGLPVPDKLTRSCESRPCVMRWTKNRGLKRAQNPGLEPAIGPEPMTCALRERSPHHRLNRLQSRLPREARQFASPDSHEMHQMR